MPPPPPPPPPPPQFVPISNTSNIFNTSNSDSRQNLLKDIRKGTKLKSVDKTSKIETKMSESIVSVSNNTQNNVQKGPIMTSLAKELEEHIRRKSLDLSSIGPQSYYRWHNTNQTNYSTLDRRTRFKEPPVPLRRASHSQGLIEYPNQSIQEFQPSKQSIDSDFSDCEDNNDHGHCHNEEDDRLKFLKFLKTSEPKFIIDRNNCMSYDLSQTMKSHPIITDIYHIERRN